MSFKIYTKTGDSGKTGLYGGTRVSKAHLRIESYGTVDELNSHLGLLADLESDANIKAFLLGIQHKLFTLGSILAADPAKTNLKVPELKNEHIVALEEAIDGLDAQLPPLRAFVLPSGHVHASSAHIARTVCRRAERLCVALNDDVPLEPMVLIYLNRLSDYLFTFARFVLHRAGKPDVEWHAEVE
jgi:cob(I)alamin adenosyltransferase